jgi:pyrimidine operon attenuation protein/uracil phosphoribosyltransferase
LTTAARRQYDPPDPEHPYHMHKNLTPKSTILDAQEMARIIRRMAVEIVERNGGVAGLMLAGIRTRGVPLAERIAAEIERMEGQKVPLGALDITLYRDDLSTIAAQPQVKGTHLPLPIDDIVVVLCDDVLYTGRTVRAALDELIDFGRPKAVQLAVLIDRGHRELPIQANFVGKMVPTSQYEVIEVSFLSTDDTEQVRILERPIP